MELNDIDIKIELTAEDCIALMHILKFFRRTAQDYTGSVGDSELAYKVATRILGQTENAMANSQDVRVFLAQKEESDRQLMDIVNNLIKGDK